MFVVADLSPCTEVIRAFLCRYSVFFFMSEIYSSCQCEFMHQGLLTYKSRWFVCSGREAIVYTGAVKCVPFGGPSCLPVMFDKISQGRFQVGDLSQVHQTGGCVTSSPSHRIGSVDLSHSPVPVAVVTDHPSASEWLVPEITCW